jgi:hypothetical protein
MTLRFRELIDAPSLGCDHETSFAFRACWVERAFTQGFFSQGNDGSHSQIEFLGSARIDADG